MRKALKAMTLMGITAGLMLPAVPAKSADTSSSNTVISAMTMPSMQHSECSNSLQMALISTKR